MPLGYPECLVRRGNIFYFRRAVPLSDVSAYGTN
jgi:hypothetical protein